MNICPRCEKEHSGGTETCSACQIELLRVLTGEMNDRRNESTDRPIWIPESDGGSTKPGAGEDRRGVDDEEEKEILTYHERNDLHPDIP